MPTPISATCESARIAESPETLVLEYGPLVSSLCRRMIDDREKARDAAMEVWAEILKSLGGFRGESQLSTWITVVARRTINRWIADEKEYDFRTFAKECETVLHPPIEEFGREDPERIDLWTRMLCDACLTSILHCLEPETRFIFILRAVMRFDYAEISRVMEMGEPAVRQRFSRASRKLARFGKKECALINPEGKCRCGQKKFLDETTLVAEFRRMRALANRLEPWADAETVFPGVNYWRDSL